jgi:glycosyltransferase involved in cell wall biosynthesis
MNPHPRLDTLRQNPNIEIIGSVPEILPFLHAANLFVIPMRVGGGTRFKALEAMAARKAIVSTTLGVEGIGVTSGEEMLLADTPDEFAMSILRLLADQQAGSELTRRLGDNAYRFVRSRYTWDHIIPRIEALYSQLSAKESNTTLRPLAPTANVAHHEPREVKR